MSITALSYLFVRPEITIFSHRDVVNANLVRHIWQARPPVGDLARRIVEASLNNVKALKSSIRAKDDKDHTAVSGEGVIRSQFLSVFRYRVKETVCPNRESNTVSTVRGSVR